MTGADVKAKPHKEIPENVRAKWGSAARDGYQAVPHSLFRYQHSLGLSASELVTLLNIADFWWEAERKPWPSSVTLANRMGVEARTVQRNLKKLELMGYIAREAVPGKGYKQYNLDGLIRRLQHLALYGTQEKPSRRWKRDAGAEPQVAGSLAGEGDQTEQGPTPGSPAQE